MSRRVIIADESVTYGALLGRYLEAKANFTVRSTYLSLSELVREPLESDVDLLLIDWGLLRSGTDVAIALVRTHVGPDCRIVLLAYLSMSPLLIRYEGNGVDAVLDKADLALNPALLIGIADRLCGSSRPPV